MDPFVGQLTLGAWPIVPRYFAACNGQILQISTNQALFALLGTRFGGDGMRTFGLPDLRGRTPIGYSQQFPIGTNGGEVAHALTMNEVPPHVHTLNAGGASDGARPAGNMLGSGGVSGYAPLAGSTAMHASAVSNAGSSLPHENRQPYLVMNWIICLNGVFPSRP